MTPNESKKDVARRLNDAGIIFDKLSAKTVSFEGLGFGSTVFVTIKGGKFPLGWNKKEFFSSVPKPSEGGYCVEIEGAIFS